MAVQIAGMKFIPIPARCGGLQYGTANIGQNTLGITGHLFYGCQGLFRMSPGGEQGVFAPHGYDHEIGAKATPGDADQFALRLVGGFRREKMVTAVIGAKREEYQVRLMLGESIQTTQPLEGVLSADGEVRHRERGGGIVFLEQTPQLLAPILGRTTGAPEVGRAPPHLANGIAIQRCSDGFMFLNQFSDFIKHGISVGTGLGLSKGEEKIF